MLPPGGTQNQLHGVFPGLGMCYTDPAQPVTAAVEELDDLSVDDLSIRGEKV